AGVPVARKVRRKRTSYAPGRRNRSQAAPGRLGTFPRGESFGGQPGGAEKIRGSGAAASRSLSRNGRTERPDAGRGLVSTGSRARMDGPTLPGLGQAGEGCRVEETVTSTKVLA